LSGGPGDPPRTKEELKAGLKLAFEQGLIDKAEFDATLTYLDYGIAGVVGQVLYDNKWEIVTTAA
jgi:hypothetical protein